MVDIVVGRVPSLPPIRSGRDADNQPIEAKVLSVRPPRQRRKPGRYPNRREKQASPDPPGSRVVVLLVPEAHRLPDDLDSEKYRILLRIVRR